MDQFVSVIIPVFNDAERLKICLAALEAQTYTQDYYEVIVVDNGSDESLEGLIQNFSQAKFAYCNNLSSYAARNHGITLAKGEILAFTDADCIPKEDWLETGVKKLLSTANCGLVAGKIEIFFKNRDRPTAVELYDSVTFFNQPQYIKEHKYGATANIFTYKSVFERVGLFNSQLKSGGDKEWGQRVFAQGYDSVYADEACVAHPARYTLGQMYRKISRVRGVGYEQARATQPLLVYLLTTLSHLKPPFRTTRRKLNQLSQEGRLKNTLQTTQVIFVSLAMHYLGFFAQTYRDQ
ncbi:glycosyltransferase family 2 protein [Pleurocapsa sp. PCC 7319]|uniref:glycosyltransferase n=1 Tax=Pleurocapsa sp. PCC 7319 TaxID=118161 RepID=UPI0003453373|nr:glycosyltransferase [Pleurocapsa sp. PCC 7319]